MEGVEHPSDPSTAAIGGEPGVGGAIDSAHGLKIHFLRVIKCNSRRVVGSSTANFLIEGYLPGLVKLPIQPLVPAASGAQRFGLSTRMTGMPPERFVFAGFGHWHDAFLGRTAFACAHIPLVVDRATELVPATTHPARHRQGFQIDPPGLHPNQRN
jgi:hypothetical protein